MNQELKARWVAELRSGKHQQARGVLVDAVGGLCCLGVFHLVIEGEKPTADKWSYKTNQCPDTVRESLHVETQNTLAEMNDAGKSFGEIADYIEAKL